MIGLRGAVETAYALVDALASDDRHIFPALLALAAS